MGSGEIRGPESSASRRMRANLGVGLPLWGRRGAPREDGAASGRLRKAGSTAGRMTAGEAWVLADESRGKARGCGE